MVKKELIIRETGERCVQTCGCAPCNPYVCVKIMEGKRTGKELWIHKDKVMVLAQGESHTDDLSSQRLKSSGGLNIATSVPQR